MRRSICLTEPKFALAGETANWKFIYVPANNLPKGTRMRFDMCTLGREIDWQVPQVGLRKKSNTIWLTTPEGKVVAAEEVETDDLICSEFEFTLPEEVKSGDEVTIHVGATGEKEIDKNGNLAQCFIQRRRPFYLYIDPKGKGDYKEPEVFHMDVRGNDLESIRIVAPSMVSKNQRFDVIVRFEDAYGNLTGRFEEKSLIELTYEGLRENLSWKLFIPETGFIALPNLYFNEEGIYKFKLTNIGTGDVFYSMPIKCFQETEMFAYWGLLHGESERYDSVENIESSLRNFRDDKSQQFFASSPFEWDKETSNEEWKHISNQINDFNEAERFVTFLGFQWSGEKCEEGVRTIIYNKDGKQLLRRKDNKSSTLKKLYKSHSPKEIISIPTFTMGKGQSFDFKDFAPEYERVVEIYNSWGSSECLEKEGNLRPIKSPTKKPYSEAKEGSVRAALNAGHRFGFVAGGLDDRGIYEELYHSEQVQYTPGLTAILATEQSREGLFNALYTRSCYATTGPRIIAHYTIATAPMGSEICAEEKPGLLYNRHIQIFAASDGDLKEIEIYRNGKLFKTMTPSGYHFETEIDDTDPLDSISLTHPETGAKFTYYYMRIIQQDGHMAWASPIWVDIPQTDEDSSKRRKR